MWFVFTRRQHCCWSFGRVTAVGSVLHKTIFKHHQHQHQQYVDVGSFAFCWAAVNFCFFLVHSSRGLAVCAHTLTPQCFLVRTHKYTPTAHCTNLWKIGVVCVRVCSSVIFIYVVCNMPGEVEISEIYLTRERTYSEKSQNALLNTQWVFCLFYSTSRCNNRKIIVNLLKYWGWELGIAENRFK